MIRFTTQNALAGHWTARQTWRRVLRPRVLLYGTMLAALCLGLLWSLAARMPLKVDVVRDRAALSRSVAGGRLENVYRLQVMNATEQPQRYRISASGLDGMTLASDPQVDVGPAQSRWLPVRLQIVDGSAPPGSHVIAFTISDASGQAVVSEKSVFLIPH